MMQVVVAILGALGLIAKHPIFLKVSFFSIFILILHYVVDFFLAKVNFDLISNTIFFEIANYFGLISAILLYIKVLISVYFAKQLVSYFRSF